MRFSSNVSLALAAGAILASPTHAQEQYEIRVSYETSSETSSGGSSSSRGRNGYTETVTKSDGCTTRTFDSIDQQDRERPLAEWQLPVTVADCPEEVRSLANRSEMEARLEAFLSAMEVTREVCGKHYFTWNVFKIECEPETILELIDHISLGEIPLESGGIYSLQDALGAAPLELVSESDGTRIYVAEGRVDPDALREQAVRADIVVKEIFGEAATIEEVSEQFADYEFSGDFLVKLTVDDNESAISRVIETSVEIKEPDGTIETRTGTETTQRKRVGSLSTPDPSETQLSE